MSKYASKVVDQAKAWLGYNEADGSHKKIIDIYNSHKPYARGVKMQYDWEWCACTWSALAIELGYTDIIPLEISCSKLIELSKEMGIWQEDDAYVPAPGDGVVYDWQDKSGKADNKGAPDHIGVVECVKNGIITVIEGNYSNSVKRRQLEVNGKYIRGFICPKYDAETTATTTTTTTTTTKGDYTMEMRNLKKGCKGEDVRALQILLNGRGYNCGKADGDFGSKTDAAVRDYQKAKGLTQDGIAGKNTMSSLIGAK